jgi:small conductance mechanosensitive channel
MDLSLNLAEIPHALAVIGGVIVAAAVGFLPRLLAALAVILVGYFLAGWIARALTRAVVHTGRMEPTLLPVIGATIRYAVLIVVVVAALAQLGVQTTSLIAALGAAGLAIGLALQGTLQNIAAGIMLLWLRPFRVGDLVESPAVIGTVEEVGLFATRLQTAEGIYKFVPNAELWNKILTNYSRNPTRLLVLGFAIPYDQDVSAARRALTTLAEGHPKVLRMPPPEVVPLALGETAVTLELRAWTSIADFWPTRWDLTESGKAALEAAGVAGPVPRLVCVIGDIGPAAPVKAA